MPISRKPSCPTNYILRDSYKTKSGKCTPSRCIRKTGLIKGKSSEREAKHLEEIKDQSIKVLKMSIKRGIKLKSRCSKKQIMRRGYTRKSYNRKTGNHYRHALIAPGCITKRGKSKSIRGKQDHSASPLTSASPSTSDSSARIYFDEDDHFLSEFGYYDVEMKSKEERQKSLHKLINHFLPIKGEMATYNYVIKALNARYIVNKNTNPKVSRIFKQDQRMISMEYKKMKMA